MDYEFYTNVHDDSIECLISLLESYGRAKGLTITVPPNRPIRQRTLNIAVYSLAKGGKLVGGLIAGTLHSWLEINLIYVMDIVSRQGLGRRLMAMAEEEAVKRGCKHGIVDTMEFLAPEFFRNLGYNRVGEVPDWNSQGHSRLLLTKRLVAKPDRAGKENEVAKTRARSSPPKGPAPLKPGG